MDFYKIVIRENKKGQAELVPNFIHGSFSDLMIRGGSFYAIWDEEQGMWSRDPHDVIRIVDSDLAEAERKLSAESGNRYNPRYLWSSESGSWDRFLKFTKNSPDRFHELDNKIIFSNTEVKKTDYATRRLPYALQPGDYSAWEELVGTLYGPEARTKIEWAIGSIVAGDSKKLQKFLVFYGPAGTGKSTILNIIDLLFDGYTTTFDGKALGSTNAQFATEVFKHNPLVAIQHDGDLSRLEDNTRLNSIISHESMTMNEKYKSSYTARINAMLFMGSNQPVKISDAKSGLLRRLIDVHPSQTTFTKSKYDTLMSRIEFELGAIAHHCLQVYTKLGPNFYGAYRPREMQLQTDVFFNFIEAHFDIFTRQNHITLRQAYNLYKEFCSDTGIEKVMPMYKMREELRDYFDEFKERGSLDGEPVRSLYSGFHADKFKAPTTKSAAEFALVLEETESLLDGLFASCPAQLAKADGTPKAPWSKVTTALKDIDTSKLHWVRVPENHIVIDFDLKDDDGSKALGRNLEAASEWPPTYAELSKSGSGVHLHYSYTGDSSQLAQSFSDGIEIKVYRGEAALRRLRSKCNAVPVSEINGGLPLKEKKEKMLQPKTIGSEKGLRDLIQRNLRKEIHPGTKPSVDFIKKILDEAYESGMEYDVTDLRNKVMSFATKSSNQAVVSMRVVRDMKWASENNLTEEIPGDPTVSVTDDRIAFFDVEVYPNLFVICWKFKDADEVVKMINPKHHEVSALFTLKLVGFYNRRYDNHILYAAAMGASVEELFKLSEKLVVEGNRSAAFGAAYNLSYADIWDFSSERMSLKKFEIKLGILHMELDLPWNEPVDEKDIPRIVEYCANDVRATEAVFNDRKGDFVARQILAELSGLSVNDTTQAHTARILFGKDKHPQKKFVYTDLSKDFPGYRFELGKSSYRDEDPGEGGYVYAEPGIYRHVAVLDVASMHPATIEILNLFGPYTERYTALRLARVAIKRKEYESARAMIDGRLRVFLDNAENDPETANQLAYALKIALNTVYGLTSAKFDNPFRDIRNVDNIVAKRGALFMIDLKQALQKQGVPVIHIKTDSIKVSITDLGIIDFIIKFGAEYGYDFEHEVTYDKFCLVNDAVYVAGVAAVPWDDAFPAYTWTATGAQFQHPVVFKRLFSGEEETFDDYCEARSVVKGSMYLHFDNDDMRHVGRTGLFVPVISGGGSLYRLHEDKHFAVAGTKGYSWMEAHVARNLEDVEIDYSYFEKLVDAAVKTIEKFGSYEEFVK